MIDLDVLATSRALQAGHTTPLELTRAALERITALDPHIHAFSLVAIDRALDDAQRATDELAAGQRRSLLHGIPFAVKDLIDTAGIETSAGSPVLAGRVPPTDASAVKKLTQAGAVLLGKTHTHEFAIGVLTPATRNPLDLDRTAGGSSGGSAAAVAAGYCAVTLGTDTIGSIRIPASVCGVVGLRPTHNAIDTTGVFPLAPSLDTLGPITRSVTDAAIIFAHLRRGGPGADERTILVEREAQLGALVIGVPGNYFFDDVHPDVATAVLEAIGALESAGATLRTVTVPRADETLRAAFDVCLPEAARAHAQFYPQHGGRYGQDVKGYLDIGFGKSAHEYTQAQRIRHELAGAWTPVWDECDVLIAPTLPVTAARFDQLETASTGRNESVVEAYLRLNAPAVIAGIPSLSVPCGRDREGLPIGLQIMAPPAQDTTVLRVGRAWERIAGTTSSPGSGHDMRSSSRLDSTLSTRLDPRLERGHRSTPDSQP